MTCHVKRYCFMVCPMPPVRLAQPLFTTPAAWPYPPRTAHSPITLLAALCIACCLTTHTPPALLSDMDGPGDHMAGWDVMGWFMTYCFVLFWVILPYCAIIPKTTHGTPNNGGKCGWRRTFWILHLDSETSLLHTFPHIPPIWLTQVECVHAGTHHTCLCLYLYTYLGGAMGGPESHLYLHSYMSLPFLLHTPSHILSCLTWSITWDHSRHSSLR